VSEDELLEWYRISQVKQFADGHELPGAVMLSPIKVRKRNSHDLNNANNATLKTLLQLFYSKLPSISLLKAHRTRDALPLYVQKFKRVRFGGETFASSAWRGGRDKYILTRWLFGNRSVMVPGFVDFFVQLEWITSPQLSLDQQSVTCRYAICRWFQTIGDLSQALLAQQWSWNLHPENNADNIIPIGRIASSFIPASEDTSSYFYVICKPNQLILWHPDG
jgi:hypothetical protein